MTSRTIKLIITGALAFFMLVVGLMAVLLIYVVQNSTDTRTLVQNYHQQTIRQITQQKEAPAQITLIESQVDCPILQALNSVHTTPLRINLQAKYCTPPKGTTP